MTHEKFTKTIRCQKTGNLSITDFCHNEGFHRSKFYEWKLRNNLARLLATQRSLSKFSTG